MLISQAQALAAAVNVSGGNDENKRALGMRGACELIVWAMQAFPADKVIQLQGKKKKNGGHHTIRGV
jgi:hypothetical protein